LASRSLLAYLVLAALAGERSDWRAAGEAPGNAYCR